MKNSNPKPKAAPGAGSHNTLLVMWLCLLLALVAAGMGVLIWLQVRGPAPEAPPEEPEAVETGWSATSEGERRVLALDAGHGGNDPGAIYRKDDSYERDINRDMLNRLLPLLAQHEDFLEVVVCAAEGETATPAQRAAVANKAGAELLVSLHLNSDSGAKVRGFECYAQPPQHAHHGASRSFAEALAGRVGDETSLPVRGRNGVYYAYYLPSGGGYHKVIIESGEVDTFGHQGAATFGILEEAECPAVLVEQWYISNDKDMKLAGKDSFRDGMALCLYRSICKYYGLSPQA